MDSISKVFVCVVSVNIIIRCLAAVAQCFLAVVVVGGGGPADELEATSLTRTRLATLAQ